MRVYNSTTNLRIVIKVYSLERALRDLSNILRFIILRYVVEVVEASEGRGSPRATTS